MTFLLALLLALLPSPPAGGAVAGRILLVLVVDSGCAAVTAPDGAFRLEGVPHGALVVKAWHEEGGETQTPVTVNGGPGAPLTIKLDVSGFKPAPHKNKYGKDYPPGAGT